MNRLQLKRRELTNDNEVKENDESDDCVDRDDAEGASTLTLLAMEANEFLVRELAMETREGMETGGAGYINSVEQHQHDMAPYEIVGHGPPRSPARAPTSQMADDNYFSPLSSQGDREDIGGRDSAHPLEPFDLCGDGEFTEEEEISNTELAEASAW